MFEQVSVVQSGQQHAIRARDNAVGCLHGLREDNVCGRAMSKRTFTGDQRVQKRSRRLGGQINSVRPISVSVIAGLAERKNRFRLNSFINKQLVFFRLRLSVYFFIANKLKKTLCRPINCTNH